MLPGRNRLRGEPAEPKSNLIPIGVYFLRPDAFGVIDQLVPSRRGELEITDLLNHYLPGRLFARKFDACGRMPALSLP